MNKYKIQNKIVTLSQNAIMDGKGDYSSFSILDIHFSHWDFNHGEGWIGDAWIAEATVEAVDYKDAFRIFREKLMKVVPRIALISQCYIEFMFEPYLIVKEGSDIGFFMYAFESEAVNLMFLENEKKALDLLLGNAEIPEEFYYYWNDAVNTLDYSPKLLLMFSALEALAKKRDKKSFKTPYDFWTMLLGKDLAHELFEKTDGLRNRLVHGHYFEKNDSGKDYLDIIHKKVIAYFNDKIFGEKLLFEDVVHPQRHPHGNKRQITGFVSKEDGKFDFKEIIQDFKDNDFNHLKIYKFVTNKSLYDAY